ncbi:hypothetical protein FACS1894147_02590 [Spirochaetia bacterium]|nr:hypothetical protein FACS1894147_02590 [Spirochaetia bacterium]
MKIEVKEKAVVRGILRYRKIYKDGRVEPCEGENLIVDAARNQMARLIAGVTAGRRIASIAFGTDGSVPEVEDTEITEPFTKAISGVEYPAPGQVRFNWNVAETEMNGKAVMEFGLLCEDGTLFARRIRQTPLNKDSDFSLEGDWTIVF